MKKRVIFFAITFLLVVGLAILFVNAQSDLYTVFEKDGRWYLKNHQDIYHPQLKYGVSPDALWECTSFEIPSYPEFDSLSNMASAIRNGKLTEDDLYYLLVDGPLGLRETQLAGKLLPICNLDDLYVPVLPVQEKVTFCGDSYKLYFDKYACGVEGSFLVCYPADKSDLPIQKDEDDTIPLVVLDENTAEKTALEIFGNLYRKALTPSNSEFRYQLNDGTRVLSITENSSGGVLISFWEGDVYFEANLIRFHESPTMEWLSAFGVEPLAQ